VRNGGREEIKFRQVAAAINRYRQLQLQECFDPNIADSRPTDSQREVFQAIGDVQYRYVTGGNRSGKTATAIRDLAWFITGTHPHWRRPEKWGSSPLTVLIAGQDRQLMERELWAQKLAPLLDSSEWKQVRSGNALTAVENRNTGDQIIFVSHSDGSERNRRFMQGYTAHYVLLDEMPTSLQILEELQRRLDTTGGPFIAVFTPKFRNIQIRKVVDSASPPISRKFRLSTLDNPSIDPEIQMKRIEGYSESYQRTLLYGDWYAGDLSVYEFNPETMVSPLPDYYSPGWRHVESVDPATSGKTGYTLWGEDPKTKVWYCVRAEYIDGIMDPHHLVRHCQSLGEGYNIIRRISDTMPWYIGAASALGVRPAYLTIWDKNNRREETIKKHQHYLSTGLVKIGSHCGNLIDEYSNYMWNEEGTRIVGATHFHLLDSARYFTDLAPKPTDEVPHESWESWLYDQHRKRKHREEKAKTMNKISRGGRLRRNSLWNRRRA